VTGTKCDGCGGSGIRVPAVPSCRISLSQNQTIVERCDSCERFPDDLAAARTLYADAMWIICKNGGRHAVGSRMRDDAPVQNCAYQ
jgi:hypothetical protein